MPLYVRPLPPSLRLPIQASVPLAVCASALCFLSSELLNEALEDLATGSEDKVFNRTSHGAANALRLEVPD